MEEGKRIKNLKERLIKDLPLFPNNKETLLELKGQDLNRILIHYLHWKSRIVPNRIRKIYIDPEVTSDKRYKKLKLGINEFLNKVRNGYDIYPHHSLKAHKEGYTPPRKSISGKIDSWEGKDQLLNTKGFHHFHLGMNISSSGIAERTDEVLFALVSRDKFHAVGIFDHSVFESEHGAGVMSSERSRIWRIHERLASANISPGSAYMSNLIMTSGHPFYLIRMADYYAAIIRENDERLDDRTFVNSLYDEGSMPYPKKFNFEWCLEALDIGVIDKRNKVFFNLYRGHI